MKINLKIEARAVEVCARSRGTISTTMHVSPHKEPQIHAKIYKGGGSGDTFPGLGTIPTGFQTSFSLTQLGHAGHGCGT